MKWLWGFPLMLIYLIGVYIHKAFYALNILKSKTFNLPIIAVGNLNTGGSGKTPTIDEIFKILLQEGYKTAIISRGYKRKSSEILEVRVDTPVTDSGDEPLMLKQRNPEAVVVVSSNRAKGINFLLEKHPDVRAILLDDALQHRSVQYDFSILLSDYNKPYVDDHLLPIGRLREPISAANKSDIIIVTKSPKDLTIYQKKEWNTRLKVHKLQLLLFSYFEYHEMVFPWESEKVSIPKTCILLTGIANAKPLLEHLKTDFEVLKHYAFPDHHLFREKDLQKLISIKKSNPEEMQLIITTEKDFVRLTQFQNWFESNGFIVGYLPVNLAYTSKEKLALSSKILDYVRTFESNRIIYKKQNRN